MGRTPRGWVRHLARRDRLLTRRRWRRENAPASPRCVRCGYELKGLPELICPECGATSDPAWYVPPLAAGSILRKNLVLGALFEIWGMAFLFGLIVVTMLWGCWTSGIPELCLSPMMIADDIGFLATIAVAVLVTCRLRQLRWGSRRWVIMLLPSPLLVWAYFALTTVLFAASEG